MPVPEVVHINQSDFRDAMLRLRQRGGAHQRAYNEACRIISSLSFGAGELNNLTRHGENRIDHCIKYDISNDAHRLITVHSDNYIYLLFVGSHDECDKWLDRNRGLTITFNKETQRVTVTHVTRDERREVPAVDYARLTEQSIPYFAQIEFDPSEFVSQRTLCRALREVDDQTSEAALEDLLADLNDYDPGIANLMLDVIFELRGGAQEGARARLEKFRREAIAVQENAAMESAALKSDANSDQIAVLTGLSEEELKKLFSPDKFQEWMLFLHPEQKRIVEADYEQPVVLTGVSGSGKTCVLAHRARRLAQKYPDGRIGVLTLNRSLSRLIDNQIRQLCGGELPENVQVMAFYDYFKLLVSRFGPEQELRRLKQLAERHPQGEQIVRTLERVNPQTYAREFDPLSGEHLDDTWELFCDQPYVYTLMTYVRDHIENYDLHLDDAKYLREEFSLIRSAVPTAGREDGYFKLERHGRAIQFPEKIRKHILDLLLLFEETMLSGGILDELSLTLALVPHLSEFRNLPNDLRFRCLLIDEFQDFSTRDLALLRLIPTERENGLFVAGDSVQRVMVKDLRLGAVGLDIINATWERIRRNYRNSRQILKTASLLTNAYAEKAQSLGQEIEVLDPELALRETARPAAVKCEVGDEVRAAWEYARSCVQLNSRSPWSICIITASPDDIPTSQILEQRPADFPVEATRVTGDYVRHRDSVSVATMPDVKGFDFSLVIVVGCGADQLPNPGHCRKESWRDALRLYVAMTRARDEVRLYYAGAPSEFLEAMREELTWEEATMTA
jgi:hypothetical protein